MHAFIFFFFFCLILEDCVHVAVDIDMCNVDFVYIENIIKYY